MVSLIIWCEWICYSEVIALSKVQISTFGPSIRCHTFNFVTFDEGK